MLRRITLALAVLAGTAAVVTPAYADPGSPSASDVTLATAPVGQAYRFPDIVKLHNDTLLAVVREGVDHVSKDGKIVLMRSATRGSTWSKPQTVVDTPLDDRDPKIMQMRDGTILLSFFETDENTTPILVKGTFVARSTDGGRTFSAPTRITTQLAGATPEHPHGVAASHGMITELPNGDLLAPLYGSRPYDTIDRAVVVRSTDGGRTWDAKHEITLGNSSTIAYQEPVLTVLRNGEVVALIRTTSNPVVAYLARSFDNGFHWTKAVPTDIPAQSHHLLLTSTGAVLVTYGKIDATGRPTAGRLITKPTGSWNGYPETLLYDSGNGDQANPSSAEVDRGRFLTLGYNVVARTLVGFFSTPADYAASS